MYSCYHVIHYLSFFKAAPALDDEQDRNDLLKTQEELRKLGSDRERRKYFRRKHGNKRRADPAVNLSSFSWRPTGEEGLPSEMKGKDAVTNKDEKVNKSSFAYSCCLWSS